MHVETGLQVEVLAGLWAGNMWDDNQDLRFAVCPPEAWLVTQEMCSCFTLVVCLKIS